MSDLFHPVLTGLPDETVEGRQYLPREGDPPRPSYVAEVFAVMSMASQHTFQVLTKRPRATALTTHANFWLEVNAARWRRQTDVLAGGMSDYAAGRSGARSGQQGRIPDALWSRKEYPDASH